MTEFTTETFRAQHLNIRSLKRDAVRALRKAVDFAGTVRYDTDDGGKSFNHLFTEYDLAANMIKRLDAKPRSVVKDDVLFRYTFLIEAIKRYTGARNAAAKRDAADVVEENAELRAEVARLTARLADATAETAELMTIAAGLDDDASTTFVDDDFDSDEVTTMLHYGADVTAAREVDGLRARGARVRKGKGIGVLFVTYATRVVAVVEEEKPWDRRDREQNEAFAAIVAAGAEKIDDGARFGLRAFPGEVFVASRVRAFHSSGTVQIVVHAEASGLDLTRGTSSELSREIVAIVDTKRAS